VRRFSARTHEEQTMPGDLLQSLNPAQQAAVQAGDGPTLVLAGPGSGKTRVLTNRVAYLIEERGVDPFHILAVTFTNKAAREMRERLDTLLGGGRAAALTVGTFHSICSRWLRRDVVHLGRERDFTIYDTDDQQRLMKQVLRDLNLDEKKFPPRAILSAISSAKNEFIGPDAYAQQARAYFEEIVSRCYVRYQQRLREANAFDFDDLLVETVKLFELHPDVLAHYHRRYQYVLADEYQDTNRVQYLLLKQLASAHRCLFVVGDEDQSIYAFRGADIRNIRAFEDDYPDAQVILLEQNYRSTQAILDVAQAVISGGGRRKHAKNLWTQNDKGTLVTVQEGYDQDEEAKWVADEIARLTAAGDYVFRDIAVMYRTNAQSRALEEALMTRGVRYQIVGGTRFYERKEIKDTLAYLRLIANPYDSVSLARVLNWPGRGIGQRSEEELFRWANILGVPVYTALQLLADAEGAADAPFTTRAKNALVEFLNLLDRLIAVRDQHSLGELIDLLAALVGVQEALIREYGPDEGADRWNNVQELRSVAENYALLPREAQLPTFLEEVALVADVDALKEEQDAITCITLHQAKGLEYPIVFLIGLEEGLLPHSRSLDDKEAVEEERRLFYVGATRARQRLYLLHAFRRTSFGRTNPSAPSRFLSDIPREILHQMPRRGATVSQGSMFSNRSALGDQLRSDRVRPADVASRNTRPRPDTSGPQAANFFAGQKVRHGSFGEGIVVSSKLVEGDEEVTVAFEGKGVKRLLASFAKLEKV
jgi:DNA helicase II / ATP-dependent DNA helicase PcrA